MQGGEVEYFVGGNKAAGANQFTVITNNVTAIVSGGSVNTDLVGGSYVKSTAGGGGVPSKTVVQTGDISLTITGGTFGSTTEGYATEGNVYGGSLAFNYYKQIPDEKNDPTLSVTDGQIAVSITGGEFKNFVVAGSGAVGRNSTLANNGSSLSIALADDASVTVDKHIVAGSMLQGGKSATVNGDTSVSITGTGTLSADSIIGGNYITHDDNNKNLYGGANGVTPQEQLTSTSTISGKASILIDAAKATINDEVIGGSYVRQTTGKDEASSSNSTVGSTSVIVRNGTLNANLIGGGKTNANYTGYAQSDVQGDTYVEIAGGTVNGAVIAGGMAKTANTNAVTSTTANVKGTATVTMSGGTVNGIVGGGMTYVPSP